MTGSAAPAGRLGERIEFDGELRGSLERPAELDARPRAACRAPRARRPRRFPSGRGTPSARRGRSADRPGRDAGPPAAVARRTSISPTWCSSCPARAAADRDGGAVRALSRRGRLAAQHAVADKTVVDRPAPELPREARYARLAGTCGCDATATCVLPRDRPRAAARERGVRRRRWRSRARGAVIPRARSRCNCTPSRMRLGSSGRWCSPPRPPGSIAGRASTRRGEIRSLYADVLRERAGSEPRFAMSAVVANLSCGRRALPRRHADSRRACRAPSSAAASPCAAVAPSFEWPRMFREPITLERVETEVDWWRDGRCGSRVRRRSHSHMRPGRAQGSFELRLGRGPGLPFLALEARVDRLDAARCASSCRSGA